MNQYCTEVHVHSSTRSEAITGTRVAASEKRERGGDRLSPAPIKDRQAVDGGDQRLRETVGDCEPDRLERERELLALLGKRHENPASSANRHHRLRRPAPDTPSKLDIPLL